MRSKLNDNVIIEICQNLNMNGQNGSVFNRQTFVNGIGYVTIKNEQINKIGTIYSILQLNCDFISQIQFNVYFTKSFLQSTNWTS